MRRFAILAVLALAIGAAVLGYHGPGRAVVRGHVGDVAATMLVYALLGLVSPWLPVRWLTQIWGRLVATLVIASTLEVGQLLWTGTGVAGELIVGGSFDGWDFVAYVLGALLAARYDRLSAAQKIE